MAQKLKIPWDKLREIGWTLWDPIGLFEEDWRKQSFFDEYDSYLLQAYGQVLKGRTDAQVADYLVAIETEHMSLGPIYGQHERALRVAQALREVMAAASPH